MAAPFPSKTPFPGYCDWIPKDSRVHHEFNVGLFTRKKPQRQVTTVARAKTGAHDIPTIAQIVNTSASQNIGDSQQVARGAEVPSAHDEEVMQPGPIEQFEAAMTQDMRFLFDRIFEQADITRNKVCSCS